MRLSTLSLASLFLTASSAFSRSLQAEPPLECFNPDSGNYEACNEPLPEQLSLKGSLFARLRCLDCPVQTRTGTVSSTNLVVAMDENDLFFNLTVAHDRKSLLLNSERIFPDMPTYPPPDIYISQIPLNFSRHDLEETLECIEQGCRHRGYCWTCLQPRLVTVNADFDYGARQISKEGSDVKWQITFDTIGGHEGGDRDPILPFDNMNQKMLSIIIDAKEIVHEAYVHDAQTGSTLFGDYTEVAETEYNIQTISVEFVQRSYTFPPAQPLSLWGKVRHYFGFDPLPKNGHIIYLHEDWDAYGKKGSLKDFLGTVKNEWPWDLIFIIVGSVAGGLVVVYGLWRSFPFIKQEYYLTRWENMDEVWQRMRQDGGEEEAGLLNPGFERYTDEDTIPENGEGSFSQKPLPSKPLPEKPLPDLPLIDDI